MLLFVVLDLLTISGNFGAEIILNNPELSTPCAKSLRSSTDKYVLTGTVGPNITDLTAQGWKDSVSVQILTSGSSQFVDICHILFGSNETYCTYSEVILCNFDSVDDNSTAHIRVISTAFLNSSQGIVRGELQHNNGTRIHSDKNVTLPQFYDVNTATLKLKVNGNPVTMTSSSCDSSFKLKTDNTVELCCSNTASPCYPRMSFSDGVVTENQTMCVRRTFKPLDESFTVNVTVSYSVCTLNNYISRGNCYIKISTASPSTVPTHFSTTFSGSASQSKSTTHFSTTAFNGVATTTRAAKTESGPPNEFDTTAIIVIFIVGTILVGIITVAVVLFVKILKHPRHVPVHELDFGIRE